MSNILIPLIILVHFNRKKNLLTLDVSPNIRGNGIIVIRSNKKEDFKYLILMTAKSVTLSVSPSSMKSVWNFTNMLKRNKPSTTI